MFFAMLRNISIPSSPFLFCSEVDLGGGVNSTIGLDAGADSDIGLDAGVLKLD